MVPSNQGPDFPTPTPSPPWPPVLHVLLFQPLFRTAAQLQSLKASPPSPPKLEPGMGWRTRRMAAAMVSAWATASPGNCTKLMDAGAGPLLARSSVLGAGGSNSQRAVHREVVRAMDCLARRCPERASDSLHSWVEPLLYMAADASAVKDEGLACGAVEALAVCVSRGDRVKVCRELSRCNALPLLSMMAASVEGPGGTDNGRKCQAVVSSLAAITTAGGTQLIGTSDREHWTALLLSWLLQPRANDTFMQSCSEVLSALSQVDGQEGMWVAQQWLSALLLHLVEHIDISRRNGGSSSSRAASASGTFDPLVASATKSSDVTDQGYEELAVSRSTVSLKAARDVVEELRSASRAAVIVHEIPPENEAHMSREALLVYPELAAKVDAALAQEVTSKALTEMCILASGNREEMRWLLDAGLLSALKRITLLNDWQAGAGGHENHPMALEGAPLPNMQSTARVLSILATDRNLHHWINDEEWGQWLRAGAASSDCRLSSCCTKALLMLESAQGDAGACIKNLSGFSAGLALLAGERPPHAGPPLVLHDGMQLLDPAAEHHLVLAREGTASNSSGAPLMDLLFVHGVRGNAFGTWRQLGGDHATETITHDHVWPFSWLKGELPCTRLLSYEYSAPVSNREGRSLSIDDLVESTTGNWLAAGLGERPVAVVCHSLGGVLLKEVIRYCQRPNATAREAKLPEALVGAVFYATPHFGTYLADIGWGLRYVAASPATVIRHLKPGAHHDSINEALRALYARGNLRVLSFGETIRTPLVSIAPWLSQDAAIKMEVVPMESAHPGIGDFVALHGVNHINACKPSSPLDASYTRTRDFLQEQLARVREKTQAEGSRGSDGE
eukprot:CAMPEP_0117661086 /NCGR_PEP_ID=MMETSP0804-20121206/7354_1 /TAXON_ID=1074897 /ORGANISM="Tetraselmis astigmatica, Strain CCMP880" /LENGTH=849 /DNA_ID=CAMNT_0005467939 /DNA_START=350 /DNA_END=2899 /DNA_ORIENTATION=+